MDLTKDAINKIEELVKSTQLLSVNGKVYSHQELHRVYDEPLAQAEYVHSLTGFVDFIDRNVDNLELVQDYIVKVEDVTTVRMVSVLSDFKRRREIIVQAELDDNFESFPFDRFLEQEDFLIKLHSLFEKKEGDDFDYVSQMISKIKQANSADTEDDGVTQRVTLKKGVSGALSEQGTVKHIVKLSPYRTFREIKQPESQFLLRIKTNRDGSPLVALFEADGGSWRNEARLEIAKFLKDKIYVSVIA